MKHWILDANIIEKSISVAFRDTQYQYGWVIQSENKWYAAIPSHDNIDNEDIVDAIDLGEYPTMVSAIKAVEQNQSHYLLKPLKCELI